MHLLSGFSLSLKSNRTNALLLALVACLSIFANESQAQRGFVSDASAANAGLAVAWSTQLEISVKEELVDWQLVVDENRATTYVVIEYEKRKEVISESDLSPFGVPYGIEGAQQAAEDRKEIIEYRLRNDGKEDVEVSISSYSLPKSSLYALGQSGQVICLNADTGGVRWKQQVGDTRLPSVGLGASNNHVAVAVGTSIHCLDSETGRILWTGRCTDVISASPAVSEEDIHVPLGSGRLQTFQIDRLGIGSFSRVAQGTPNARPIITEKNVIWTTERGHMNVAPLGRQTVSYRLKTDGPIVAQAAFAKGILYTGSLDGFVYGINQQTGVLDFEIPTGEGILSAPVAFGDDVYAISGGNKLFRINSAEGNYPDTWQVPIEGIRDIVGFGTENIYCLTTSGRLVGINRETRSITKSVLGTDIELAMPNAITDRMFFGTRGGFIQCVHEADSFRPRFLASDKSLQGPVRKKRPDKSAIGEENPFGDGDGSGNKEANPFGDGSDSKESGSDNKESNPFDNSGGDDSGDGPNPFGEESNPFGGDDGDSGGDDEENPFG